MPVGLFIAPYKRRKDLENSRKKYVRYCAIDDFTSLIHADGGVWREIEIRGNRALVKVRAKASTLALLDAEFKRIPTTVLSSPLSEIGAEARNALINELEDQGHSRATITNALGDLSEVTLLDLLKFMAKTRIKPRYDKDADEIVFDSGLEVACTDLSYLDEVTE